MGAQCLSRLLTITVMTSVRMGWCLLLFLSGVQLIGQNTGYDPLFVGTGNGCKAGGRCYFVDYENGSDDNDGLSRTPSGGSGPWKSVPGMACATGKAATHQFQQTDEFILKGGVVWPAACFPWTITGGGAITPNSYAYPGMYIGFDPSWHKGQVVSVRVVDPGSCSAGTKMTVVLSGGGGLGASAVAHIETDPYAEGDLQFVSVTNPGGGYTANPTVSFVITAGSCGAAPLAYADIFSPIMDGSGAVFGSSSSVPLMFTFTANYGTVDHLEFRHYLWYAGAAYSGGSPNMIGPWGKPMFLQNLYVHDFGMAGPAVAANLVGARNAAQTCAICGSDASLANSILNNYEAEVRGGCDNGYTGSCTQNTAVYDMISVTNNVINCWRAGIYTIARRTAGHLVAGNKVWAILSDPASQHPDAIYLLGGTIAYNNVLRDIYSGTAAFYVETADGSAPVAKGMTTYLFNNVVFGKGTRGSGTSTPPIGWTSEFVASTATSLSPLPNLRAYNNSFYSYSGNSACINAGQWFGASPTLSSSFAFTLKNNHCISSQSTGHWYSSNSQGAGYGVWNGLTGPNTSATQSVLDPTAIVQSPTDSAAQGYLISNSLAPTSPNAATVSFAQYRGSENLAALCSLSIGGVSLAPLCSDIRGTPRPTIGGWQAGAYHYPAATVSSIPTNGPSAPSGVTATVR